MKRLLVAFLCLGASSFGLVAMNGDGAGPSEPHASSTSGADICVRLAAKDENGREEFVAFTRDQAGRLAFFAQFMPGGDLNSPQNEQELMDGSVLRELEMLPWHRLEILQLVQRATAEIFIPAAAHTFVRNLSGSQACLLWPALQFLGFDPELLAVMKQDIATRLLDDAQFFIDSLTPDDTTRITDAAKKSDSARQPEWYVGLPICPFAEFLCESRLMYRQSLPSHVASKLIRQRTIPGRFKALSSNGRYVCVETDDELFVYETHGGRQINDRPLPGNTANFSKDGKFVAVGNHSLITVYITEPMAQVGQPVEGDSAWFSHDGRFVEVDRQSQITRYTTEAMEQIGQPMAGHSFTSGSKFIVVGNAFNPHRQTTIYTAETLEQVGQPIEGYGDWLSCDERFVAVCNGTRIIVYKTETLEQIGQPTTGDKAEFSPDDKFIAVRNWGDHHHQITLYTTEAMEQVGQPITGDAAGFSPDAKFIAVRNWVDAPSQITLYTTETMKQIGQPIEGYGFSFSPDGSLVAVSKFVDQHFQTTVYKTETLEQIGQPIEGNEVQFSPDGRFMWITNEEMATLYALPSMKVVHQIERVVERHFGGNIYAFGQTNALTLARDTLTFAYLEGSDSTHQMACLAAMYRKDATDETARLLDEKSEWWTRMSINAPAKIQQFVRAQFPAPEQAAGATPAEDDDVFLEAKNEDAPGIIAAPTAAAQNRRTPAAPANTDKSEQSAGWLPCKLL